MNELLRQSQRIPTAEPPLSSWSSIADPNEFWQFDHDETFGSIAPEAFNDGSKLGMSTAIDTNGEVDLPEFPNWDYVNRDMERDSGIVPEYGAFSSALMAQNSQGDALTDTLQVSRESPTISARGQKATQRPTQISEKIGSRFASGSQIDLERQTGNMSTPLPRVVVSDAALHSVGEGKVCAVPELYASTSSTVIPFHEKQQSSQNLHSFEASSDKRWQLPDSSQYLPNNYEIAMHERYPSHTMIREDGYEFGTHVAERVNAFYADADSITAKVAAGSNTNETLGGKRRRVTRNLSTLQIPIKTPYWSQGWRVSPADAVSHPQRRNTLQTLPYPTPTSSSGGSTMYNQGDIAFQRDDSPSSLATPSCVSPVRLSSPASPSPSNLSDAAEGITRCPSCPEKIFTGTPKDQKNNLQRHMRDIHKGMPRLECLVPGCTASFGAGRKDNRIKHVRAMHPDFPLPVPSTKRKRKASSDFQSY